jgi:hypothetical protein
MTELADLFRCERYLADFPRGMTYRACLRRQLERQESAKKGVEGPPRRTFCAEQCPLGRANRARFPAVELRSCARCGAALIATQECSVCEVRAQEAGKGPARGFLPEREARVSTRIWGAGAPDAPIGSRPIAGGLGPEAIAGVAERVREAMKTPSRVATPPARSSIVHSETVEPHREREAGGRDPATTPELVHPATPAAQTSAPPPPAPVAPVNPAAPTETAMACPECKNPGRHKADCSKNPEKTTAPAKATKATGKLPKLPPAPKGAKPVRPLRVENAGENPSGNGRAVAAAPAGSDLESHTIAELRALIERAQAAIRQKLEAAEQVAREAREALGEVKAA